MCIIISLYVASDHMFLTVQKFSAQSVGVLFFSVLFNIDENIQNIENLVYNLL